MAYYYVDENGNLQMSETSDLLPEVYQEIYPENVSEIPPLDSSFESVSSGDLFPQTPVIISSDNSDLVGELQQLNETQLSALEDERTSLQNVYPSSAAIDVFQRVYYGCRNDVDYVVIAGSSTTDAYMFFSEKSQVNDNQIKLLSPVTVCHYYTQRVYQGSTYITEYRYEVTVQGDEYFNLGDELVYTNLKPGYPVLGESLKHNFNIYIPMILFVTVVLAFILRGRKK